MTVLYRTYRPKTFKEVIGQDHIVSVLEGSIKNKKISHAYLFSGSRGTGKTSVARIVAHELDVKDEDIYEFDAASNRGIDDIREIREHVSAMPFSSPYKVYIIDEVHMLTKEAWNALLKTLEEPPKHAIFILATTEIHKVPETIISRCQTFSFRKPSRDVLSKMIMNIAKKEGYILEGGVADLLALLGDGSFRDALGMLEKIIGMSSDKKISLEEVSAITGAPKADIINRFIIAITKKDVDEALEALGDIENAGVSVSIFLTLVLEKLRFILLTTHMASSATTIKSRVSLEDWDFISLRAKEKTVTPNMIVILLEANSGIRRAVIDVLPLELAVVRICG
ncbi:MAG: DNA polymerase III subunit gamma/tau [Candidatus Paceibacterota bacterium]|jgi:DNA polymerase-3 subunit gamma/tau